MIQRLLCWVSISIVLLPCSAYSQVITNNGGTIYLSPRAVLFINGSYMAISSGRLIAEDSAFISVTGTVDIRSGHFTLNQRSIALIDSNVITNGIPCSHAYGYLIRNGSGILIIKGSLFNDGEVRNTGTIYVRRDFVNRNAFSNSGLLEVGEP